MMPYTLEKDREPRAANLWLKPQSTARAEPKHWGCSPFSQRKNPALPGDLDSYYLLTPEGRDSSIHIFAIQPAGPR